MRTRLRSLVVGSAALIAGTMLSFAFLSSTERWFDLNGAPGPASVASALDDWARRQVDTYDVKGLRVGMLQEGRLFWAGNYGTADAAGLQEVTEDTVFNVGSISKPVAMWGVLALLQDRGIDLDEPVAPYLSRWRIPAGEFDPRGVTFRRLLEHTAGLSIHGYGGFEPELDLPADVVESLNGATNGSGAVELIRAPGTERRYSGGGYTVLQLLVEEISGLPFAEYMAQAVLNPLRMTASSFGPSSAPDRSQMFSYHGSPLVEHRYVALAAAGLETSGRDMERFLEANLSPNPVLSPDRVALTFAPTALDDRFAMGYTRIAFDEGAIIGHGGNNTGWNAQIYIVPETGAGFYFLSNSTSGAQLEWDLSCAWKSWIQGESIGAVCTEASEMSALLRRSTLLLIWVLTASSAWLVHSLWTGRRALAARPRSRRGLWLGLRMTCFGLLLIVSVAAGIVLYDDFIYWREGVVFLDEVPVEELDWALDIGLSTLLVWTFLAYSSPAPAGRRGEAGP